MKNYIIIAILAMAFIGTSCQAQKQSNAKVEETGVTFLVDCTEKEPLFREINQDFHDHLSILFNHLGVGSIDWYQKITVRMCAIDDSDKLNIKSASISLTDKKISRREEEVRRSPKPLLQLISSELSNYETLSQQEQKSSPIINCLLKTFRELSPDAVREVVVVCTDGVENSQYCSFYRDVIPTTDDAVTKLVGKVDKMLLEEAKTCIKDVDPQVIFVLKSNPKVDIGSLKQFYSKLMDALGVSTYSFIDNFTNTPNLNEN